MSEAKPKKKPKAKKPAKPREPTEREKEEAALLASPDPTLAGLTPMQAAFVQHYLIERNATEAAKKAGYSEKTAGQLGYQLLQIPSIASAIEKKFGQLAQRLNITAEYILSGIVDTIERCRQAKPVVDSKGFPVFVENPEGEIVPAYTFQAKEVLKGLELLGKNKKLWTDKVEHSGKIGLESLVAGSNDAGAEED